MIFNIKDKENLIKAIRLIHEADMYIVRFLEQNGSKLPSLARLTIGQNRNTILQNITNIDEIARRCEE